MSKYEHINSSKKAMNLEPPKNSECPPGHTTYEVEPQSMIRNIAKDETIDLCTLVDYKTGQVVSRTLAQNKYLNLTLFAFSKGEGLSAHKSTGDAMVQVLDGTGIFTVNEQAQTVGTGYTIVLPANVSHAVYAQENFKMLLTVVKPVHIT